MKKMLALVLAGLLLAGFAGCNREPVTIADAKEAASDDFAALLDGRKPPGTLTEDEKKALMREGKSLGLNMKFDDDGLTISDDRGQVLFRQEEDGTMWDEFGNQTFAGSVWPDNEFTRQIPNPGIEACVAQLSADGLSAMLDEIDEAWARAYIEKLKEAGFTTETPGTGLKHPKLIEYNAQNAAGYVVGFLWTGGGASLTVNK